MAEWVSIDQWMDCVRMERPGIVFEIRNNDGQTLTTSCGVPLLEMPFDWTSPAAEFRTVEETRPQHSTPLPVPKEMP